MFITCIFCCQKFAKKYLADKTIKFRIQIGKRILAKFDHAVESPMVQIMGMSRFGKKPATIYEQDVEHFAMLLQEWNPFVEYFDLMDVGKYIILEHACVYTSPTCAAHKTDCRSA